MFSTTSRFSDDRPPRAGGADRLPPRGIDLLQEVTGGQPVSADRNYRSLLRQLEMGRDFGFLTFTVLHHREVTGCGFGGA
jgi:hypothetical protein